MARHSAFPFLPLVLWGTGLMMLLAPWSGVTHPAYAKPGEGIRVESNQQTMALGEGRVAFEGNIRVAMAGVEVTGPAADIRMDDSGKPSEAVFSNRATMVRQNGALKQTVQADTLNMGLQNDGLKAQGKVVTKIDGQGQDGEIIIRSDTQVFDQEKNVMRASGHVQVKKGDMQATSPEAVVFLGSSGSPEKVVFYKGATLAREGQTMRGESITINLASGDIFAEKNTESLIVTEDTTGRKSQVKIRAHLQELDNETGTLLANGNAVLHFDDYVAKGPKAVFYQAHQQLDRIVLSGRAEIEDPERRVVGDTVTIRVNPKQFNVEGNVNTFIKARQQEQSASAGGAAQGKPATANTPEPGHDPDALEQELMIENLTRQQETGTDAP